jgi:Tfp pilus assembly PilM family ATPase
MKDKLKKVIGLEIFVNELRAAEISGSPAKIKVDAYNSVSVPDGVISDGLIMKPEVFMQYLKDMLSGGGFKSKDIVAEIISRNLILRLASFPKVTADKQNNVIMLQAQDFIPIPLAELELSYVITGEITTDEGTYVNTLLAAMKKNIISSLMDTIQNKRFGSYSVNDITIGVTALANEVARQTAAETYMVMYFNNVTLDILIINNNNIVMARSAQLDVNVSDALNNSGSITYNDDIYNEIIDIIKNEFWTSANFFNIKNKEDISKVYIYAQSIDISESISNISSDLDIEIECISISHKLREENNMPGDKYLGCICIAAGKL